MTSATFSGGVDAFYAELGHPLPGRGAKAPIRCFAAPEAHKRDDRNPSAEVDRRSGYWRCYACGEHGPAYRAALALGVRPAEAMQLLERHGLKKEKNGDWPDSGTRGNGRVPNAKPQAPPASAASEDQLTRWRERLLADERLLARLRELRGWTRPTSRRSGSASTASGSPSPSAPARVSCSTCCATSPASAPRASASSSRPRDGRADSSPRPSRSTATRSGCWRARPTP